MPAQNKKRKKRRHFSGDSRTVLGWFFLFSAILLAIGVFLRLLASWQNRIWVGNSRVTFVSAGPPVELFTYQTSHELVSITFPKDVEINSALGLGNWKIENLYTLGKQKGLGGMPLVKSLEYSLNIPIDGFLAGNFSSGFPASLKVFFVDTNFTFFDKLKIALTLSQVDGGENKVLSAQKLGIVAQRKLEDGSTGYKLADEKLKIITDREFQDSQLTNDKSGVGIINGTSFAGVGEKMAGIIKTMGVQVVWVKSGEFSERCVVRVARQTITSAKIAKLFSCKTEYQNNLPANTATAPIEFVVGPALAEELPR